MTVIDAGDERALVTLYAGGWDAPREIRDRVTAILDDVRARGDAAVVAFTQQFDFPEASIATLRRDVPTRKHARGLVPETIAAGLELARERITDYHARQIPHDIRYRVADNTEYAFLARPLHSIGAYVPGGTASLPSTVLMTVVPAKVAGVDRVVVTTPPQRDGSINPAILYACSLCEVDELYAVGGAQAVAALAYGTQAIAAVDKIVGPGNVLRDRSQAPGVRRLRHRRARGAVRGAGRVRRAIAARFRRRRDHRAGRARPARAGWPRSRAIARCSTPLRRY